MSDYETRVCATRTQARPPAPAWRVVRDGSYYSFPFRAGGRTVVGVADFIKCPTCKTEIPLTEVIDHEIAERLETRLAAALRERERAHAAALAEREQELRAAFEQERAPRDEAARIRAEERVAAELADLKAVADERDGLLKQAQERELVLRQERRKLEDERQDLEVLRKVDAERKQIAAKAREVSWRPTSSS